MVTRMVVRTVASLLGLTALLVTAFLLRNVTGKDAKRERFREGVAASAAIRQELERDCVLRVDPAPGSDKQVVVEVRFRDVPDEPTARTELVRNTNMVVRRLVHHVRDVNILFDDEPNAPPPRDSGVAVAAAPAPVAVNVTTPAPAPPPPARIAVAPVRPASSGAAARPSPTPKPAKTGTVTLVTFPEADVLEGSQKLGRTPLFDTELPVGTHMLTLVGEDGVRHRLSMPVVTGKNKPLKLNLAELPVR